MIKVANAEAVPERVDALLANLIKHKACKPRTVETLRNTIKTCFANKLPAHEIQDLLDRSLSVALSGCRRERWSTSCRRELEPITFEVSVPSPRSFSLRDRHCLFSLSLRTGWGVRRSKLSKKTRKHNQLI